MKRKTSIAAVVSAGLILGGLTPASAVEPALIEKATELTTGGYYVFASGTELPGLALGSTPSAAAGVLPAQPVAIDSVEGSTVWKLTEVGTDVFLESAALPAGENFLNLALVDGVPQADIGAAQPLEIVTTTDGQEISATVDGTEIALGITDAGFVATASADPATPADASPLQAYTYNGDIFHGTDPILDGETLVAGNAYIIALGGILNSGGTGFATYSNNILRSVSTAGTLQSVSQFADRPADAAALPFDSRWVLEGTAGDFALRAQDGSGFLRLDGTGASIAAERQTLVITQTTGDRFTITATVDGQIYHLDWNGTAIASSLTGSSNSAFSISTYRWGAQDLSPITEVPLADIVDGETYVFGHYNIYSLQNNAGVVALSSEGNGHATAKLQRGERFSTIRENAPNPVQWRAEKQAEGGWALQAVDHPGQYLNITAEGTYLGERQSLELLEGANGTAKISATAANGSRLYIRFTAGNGGGWQAGTADGSNTFSLFTAPLVGADPLAPYVPGEGGEPVPEVPTDPSLLQIVSADAIVSGKNYVLGIPGVVSADKGNGTFAITSRDGEGLAAMREHEKFDDPSVDYDYDMTWKIEEFDGGYSLESPTVEGANRFLNIDAGTLTMGTRQALDFTITDGRVRLSRTVDGIAYNVRFTGASGVGWQAATPTSTSNFVVWEYTGAEYFTNGIVESAAIIDGGEYAFVIGGVVNPAGTGWSEYKAYAMSRGGAPVAGTMPAIAGLGADTLLTDDQYWIVERMGTGFSLHALGAEADRQYLNIAGSGTDYHLEMSPDAQALTLERKSNGLIGISMNSGTQSLTFSTTSKAFVAKTGAVKDQITVWEQRWSLEPLTNPKRTTLAEVQNGSSYVFASAGTSVIGQQYQTTAIIGQGNGNVSVGLMDEAPFGLTDLGAPELMQWRVAQYDGGYSMQSLATPTTQGYLNIEVIDGVAHASLGARQAIDLVANGSDVHLTRTIDGTRYYLRYTGANGHGWQASTNSGSSLFRIYQTPVAELTVRQPLEKINAADVAAEGSWAFVSDHAVSDGIPGALDAGESATGTLPIEQFYPEESTISPTQRWILQRSGDRYALSAEGIGGPNSFLRIGSNGLSIGAFQELQLEVLASGGVKILGDDGTQKFAIGIVDGKWAAVNPADGREFSTYRINFSAINVPDVAPIREDPGYTISGFSDMHVDYGFQSKADPIRESTREAARRVGEEENPDLVLQGGDIISDNGNLPWTQENWVNVTSNMKEMLSGISESGQVLNVNGNHDYEVGLEEWNSGDWIDSFNEEATGEYLEVLYEGADRDNNLIGYVTIVDGIKVIALSTPYNGDWKYTSYHYTLEQVEWFEKQLAQVAKDETVIAFTHYPLQERRGGTGPGYGMNNALGQNDRIKAAMLPHPNLVHLYGHDHGAPFVSLDSWEKVTSYKSDGSISEVRGERTDSFTSVFLGSTSYYNNQFNPGWLGETNPSVVQPLLMHVYDDRIEFEYKNYGQKHGEREFPFTYSLPLTKKLSSDLLTIDGATVSGIAHETTAAQIGDYFDLGEGKIVVRGFDGEILTPEREIRSDYKLQLVSANGIVQDELTAVVNAAALQSHAWKIDRVSLVDASGAATNSLAHAAKISGTTLSARDSGSVGGVFQIALFDAEGSYLTSQTVPVTAGGDIALDLSVADLPEGASYRAFVLDSLATATPLSEPHTSDGEKPLAENIPTSAESELVMGMNQANNSIQLFDQDVENWDTAEALVWEWKPSAANGFGATMAKYTNVTDAKLRWSDFYGDYVVVTTSSGGFVGLFDYATGEKLYESRLNVENNPHAVEILPDGNIVAASSNGASVTVYAATTANGMGWSQKNVLEDAHAVNWDPDMNVLWAAGSNVVQGYELTGTTQEPTLTAREDLKYLMPEGGAHDMIAAYGIADTYWLSGHENIFQFNARTGEFSTDFNSYDLLNDNVNVKGLGSQPFTGNYISVAPNYQKFSWNSDSIRLYEKTGDGYILKEKFFVGDEFYKSRPWHAQYE